MTLSAEPEGGPSHFPAADAARHGEVDDARRRAKPVGDAEFHRRTAQQLFGGPPKQPLAGTVDQPQALRRIEGEHGDVDLLHHRAQQRRGLDGAEPLLVQGLGQRVDLGHHVAERIPGRNGAAADREVVLAHRRDEVGQRLQRSDDVDAQRHQATGRHRRQQRRQRPLHLRRITAGPQQDHGNDDRRQRRAQRQRDGMLIKAKAVHEIQRGIC
jgi:hypothetical protein